MESRFTKIFATLLQSDVATRLTQNEALMNALMRAFSVSMELRHLLDQRIRALIQGLDLAKQSEVEGLREELSMLQERLAELEDRLAEQAAAPARGRKRPASRTDD
jgi:polyhydroxyalkanoate synthesis regulator phasin